MDFFDAEIKNFKAKIDNLEQEDRLLDSTLLGLSRTESTLTNEYTKIEDEISRFNLTSKEQKQYCDELMGEVSSIGYEVKSFIQMNEKLSEQEHNYSMEIDLVQEKFFENITLFQNNMNEIAENYVNAVDLYRSDGLENELKRIKEDIIEIDDEIFKFNEETEQNSLKIEKLKQQIQTVTEKDFNERQSYYDKIQEENEVVNENYPQVKGNNSLQFALHKQMNKAMQIH